MFRRISKGRATAVVVLLLVALAVPAWAAGAGAGLAGWSPLGWLWSLVDRWVGWEKEGICIDPAGKPCTPGGTAANQPARPAGGSQHEP